MGQNQGFKSHMRTIGQKFVVILLKALSHLPLAILYLLADLLYYVVAYLIQYRSSVIDDNLRHAFPEMSQEERDSIRMKYYRHFCEISVETIKLYCLPIEELKTRYKFPNIQILNEPYPTKEGVITLAFHYNNWEWGIWMELVINQKVLMVYNQMRNNPPFDKFLLDTRKRCGGVDVVMSQAARTAFEYKRRGESAMLWLAADQSAPHDAQFWGTFFNREAPFFGGPVKLAQKLNQPLYFQKVRKLKRGYYVSEFELLFKEPAKVEAGEILRTYARKMEEVIREAPEYYLWSHRRWKHKRPEGTALLF